MKVNAPPRSFGGAFTWGAVGASWQSLSRASFHLLDPILRQDQLVPLPSRRAGAGTGSGKRALEIARRLGDGYLIREVGAATVRSGHDHEAIPQDAGTAA